MPSLISTTERAILTGIFADIFDTFSRTITVYKEPTRTIIPVIPTNFVFGFGIDQAADSFSYTVNSQVFPAVIRYQEQLITQNSELDAFISAGEVNIKVKKDCRDYINDGRTDKIVFDNRTFYLDGDERKQTFLDSEFYIFKLKATK